MIKEIKELIKEYSAKQKDDKSEGRRQTSLNDRGLLSIVEETDGVRTTRKRVDSTGMVCTKINNEWQVQKNKMILHYLHLTLDVMYGRQIREPKTTEEKIKMLYVRHYGLDAIKYSGLEIPKEIIYK